MLRPLFRKMTENLVNCTLLSVIYILSDLNLFFLIFHKLLLFYKIAQCTRADENLKSLVDDIGISAAYAIDSLSRRKLNQIKRAMYLRNLHTFKYVTQSFAHSISYINIFWV